MKKILLVLSAILVFVALFYIFTGKQKNNMSGKITYCAYNDSVHGAYVLDLSTNKQIFIPDCISIKLFASDKALVGKYKIIEKSNIETMDIEDSYDIEETMDYFTMVNDSAISFSNGKNICTFDLKKRIKTILAADNGAKYHGWRDGKLIYANTDDEIVEYDLSGGNEIKLADGREPIVSADNNVIAYKDLDGKLNVFNIKTNERYIYNGYVYYYCFSPKSDMLLIEDEMKLLTSLKNMLVSGRTIGHRIIVWDYRNNNKIKVLDECTAGAGEGFSWK